MDFVLSGKASQVFKWLEIKTRRTLEAQRDELNLLQEGHPCWYFQLDECSIPMNLSCRDIDCPIFVKKFGKKER